MTTTSYPSPRHPAGVSRRELLQVGYTGLLGLGLPSILSAPAGATPGDRAAPRPAGSKSVILLFLTGAPSHHDTFDLKPDAPAEVRGEFQPITGSVAGLHVCEHLPRLATRAHRYALVRSLAHRDHNHLTSTHHVLTGHVQPGAFFDKVASRDDWPCYSAACDYFGAGRDGVPTGVNLPTFLLQGPLTWPGQHAGLLGAKHDPWQIVGDPNQADVRVDNLRLAPGIEVDRFGNRRALLDGINRQQEQFAELAECRRLTDQQRQAFTMLSTQRLTEAFDLARERTEVRERYGRHTAGQSLLAARRLIEAGVRLVQVNMGAAQTWDNHGNIFPTLKDRLLPPLDQGLSALLDDLEASGLIDETLVLMLGEFGRTPKISRPSPSAAPGRDHWSGCFFGLFAGAGVRPGQVIGKSDQLGAYPLTKPYSPDDVGATVLEVLGVDPRNEIRDRLERAMQLNSGTAIRALFTGAEA